MMQLLTITSQSLISDDHMMQLTWKDLLYSERVDEFADYQMKIPELLRQQVEKFHGICSPRSFKLP
jgi:hypothetical protein